MRNSNSVNKPLHISLAILMIIVAFLQFGILSIIGTYKEQKRYNALLENGCYTTGIVTGTTYNDDTEISYTKISYTVDERVYTLSVSYNFFKYKKGNTVSIIYEAGNPSNSALENNSFIDDYLISIIFLAIGIIVSIILAPVAYKNLFGIRRNQAQTAMPFNNPRDVWNYDITPQERNQQYYINTSNYPQNNYQQNNYPQNNYTQGNYFQSDYTQSNYPSNNYPQNNSAGANTDTNSYYN